MTARHDLLILAALDRAGDAPVPLSVVREATGLKGAEARAAISRLAKAGELFIAHDGAAPVISRRPSQHALSPSVRVVLKALDNGPTSVTAISGKTVLNSGTVSNGVSILVDLGLAQRFQDPSPQPRGPKDGRPTTLVALTGLGVEALDNRAKVLRELPRVRIKVEPTAEAAPEQDAAPDVAQKSAGIITSPAPRAVALRDRYTAAMRDLRAASARGADDTAIMALAEEVSSLAGALDRAQRRTAP
ncbi:hypothetical protein [Azospirillum aestuarii]|uniref:hypothetical protein n=1 Tax=Azospirillum aestuarii TaxID=2802052 RepID=UPI0040550591